MVASTPFLVVNALWFIRWFCIDPSTPHNKRHWSKQVNSVVNSMTLFEKVRSLKLTASLPLKIDGWKNEISFGVPPWPWPAAPWLLKWSDRPGGRHDFVRFLVLVLHSRNLTWIPKMMGLRKGDSGLETNGQFWYLGGIFYDRYILQSKNCI